MSELGRVHFIGIGGAGMVVIAALMLQVGDGDGSDRAESWPLLSFCAAGARVGVPSRLRTLWTLRLVAFLPRSVKI